ncbi:allophanate hydrolase [Hansschlegelia quercus]|uniref:Allophanate hydrolase n=1 Tax=Hansschlegelia quercus TaxID=2528245 RepID=A0A4Q9GLT2_9HYPH|nr:allophanate hydrolase [Hansschlegelia quercus]TBN55258.1 allophanate hydrolase [Hansschlegelia quercus]
MTTALADLAFDLASLRSAYAAGLSPLAVVEEAFARIEAAGDPGIFIALADRDAAIAEARALGSSTDGRALWGVPFAVKDNIDVAGLPTTAACPDFAYQPERDAEVVSRLKAAGAIVVGKTNLDQFATGLVGLRTPYPAPLNAVDPALAPGGSSSGSAVSVARGLVAFSLGTDTAGSGRVPAGLNNIVGLKPTVGAVPTEGVLPACRTLDCVSVFANSVDDAYSVFQAMAGYCASDAFSRDFAKPSIAPLPPSFRVLIPDAASRRFAGDAAAETAFDATIADLKGLGAQTTEIDLEPFFAVASLLYDGPFVAERYEAIRSFIEEKPEALHPVTRKIIQGAVRFDAANAFGALYKLAELKRALGGVWASADAMLVPTYPRPHTVAAIEAEPIALNSEFGTYTNFVNLLDLCALAVPGRPRADGKPAGVTLIAPAGHDFRIAAIGEALHIAGAVPVGATGRAPSPAPARAAAAGPDEMELVVVGAHLSGMALNGEVTKLGGRFLRAVDTERSYKLFSLPGKVARPGLLRVRTGEGAAIATEVWALPKSAIGPFVSAIPSPLGFGTLRLADGTTPFGFLVEPEGIVGAEEITRYGGWRAFIGATKAA